MKSPILLPERRVLDVAFRGVPRWRVWLLRLARWLRIDRAPNPNNYTSTGWSRQGYFPHRGPIEPL